MLTAWSGQLSGTKSPDTLSLGALLTNNGRCHIASDVTLRPIRVDDQERWEPVWHGYLDFYRAMLVPKVTERPTRIIQARGPDACSGTPRALATLDTPAMASSPDLNRRSLLTNSTPAATSQLCRASIRTLPASQSRCTTSRTRSI